MATNKLTRDTANGVIAGVCAGVAEHFGWDIAKTRLIFVLVSIFSAAFPGTIVYIIMWIILPKK